MLGRTQPDLLRPPYRFWSLPRFKLVMVYDAGVNPPRILRMLSTATRLRVAVGRDRRSSTWHRVRMTGPRFFPQAEPGRRPTSRQAEGAAAGLAV